MTPGDQVRVQTFVRVGIADAFEVFTQEINAWWGKGPAFRVAGRRPSTLFLEPRLDGRVFEQWGSEANALHVIGKVVTWEPPTRLTFTWRGINFEPRDADTVVDVRFEEAESGTRVFLEHRGFAALRDDHPVRHGQAPPLFIRELGQWWASQLTRTRELAESRALAT